MPITPLILGSGRAGQAAAKALSCLSVMEPDLQVRPAQWLARDIDLATVPGKHENPILILSNPPGRHAQDILNADRAGFALILAEKPSCVRLEEVSLLRKVQTTVAIFHVYRQMWGPQTLKALLDQDELGELVSIEGRYWQSSTAERAIAKVPFQAGSWKNDPTLSGPSDALLDIGTHWIDLACYLRGRSPRRVHTWKSFKNAESSHRDSHVHVILEFDDEGRAFGSISKTTHGANNDFEINLIGTRASATWNFLNPDEILIGEGRDRRILTRKTSETGSRQPPFHGMGWLEGYIEITRQALKERFSGQPGNFPRLSSNLDMMEAILSGS